ncbi:bifunctional adenosylcobinamide kinase/adenosylcobinamide-phosphate guanylyltransferase [Fictibacillus fluitans]|uniref:Adenosylcobinamide kinase n=1 Tax=Fictibacillus fluitans TaxID=3058422 RepID=A0ABT8HYA7_9BACL|nr:bifunctional adenosylcobinamide kinase/adenosylcobinamide-phosphate guanylyltransferase [Fictibacillus sp. NE201]MDN4525763.1 bifunctional adenosylcobinamide kinase/adenosylcobinamide-phosphate guanylyltransferase [Fictibacillus sp. NE201]
MLIFITGGVRSGKSSFAEMSAVYHCRQGNHLHYVATCDQGEAEMAERISRHREDREKSGYSWKTWEQPRNLHDLCAAFEKEDVVLLDCLTNLVSNELFAGWRDNSSQWEEAGFRKVVFQKIMNGIKKLENQCRVLIIVSNEVFQGFPANDSGTFYFMQMMGHLHQHIVRQAHWVYQVELGMPILRKGYDADGNQCTACTV